METVDVHDLPEPVVRAIRDMVETLRRQFHQPPEPAGARELPRWEGTVIGRLTRDEIYDDAE
jgi:hypothetical protein